MPDGKEKFGRIDRLDEAPDAEALLDPGFEVGGQVARDHDDFHRGVE